MSAELTSLSDIVRRGVYEIPAEKVAAAILEWHMGAYLGGEGVLLRLRITPTSP